MLRLCALAAAFCLPSITGGAARSAEDLRCAARVASFYRQYAKPGTRVVLTFTGTQDALLPLSEAMSGPQTETMFFPIDRSLFVLTLQFRETQPSVSASTLQPWATDICRIAEAKGGRYNGAIAYSGNEMTAADMSPFPQK